MKILIAEDNSISRITLSAFAKQFGYEPLLAENGLTAFKLWEKESPRILITDWNMPDMDGISLVKKIREIESDLYTYIIMVTARDEMPEIIEGFEAGVDDYLKKPVDKRELLLRLQAGERVLSLQDKDMIIFALAKLAETRDEETGFHLERMQLYSKVLSEAYFRKNQEESGISRKFIDTIHATSPLHDIGKVGIRDSILLKPGRLTPEEFEVMKTHTILGYETIMSVYLKNTRGEYLRMAAEIARSHHERWDGSGYPDGLKGKAIPLAARIVALADFYDAMSTKRVYKDAIAHDIVRDMIVQESGRHFDPELVDLFLDTEEAFTEILKLQE